MTRSPRTWTAAAVLLLGVADAAAAQRAGPLAPSAPGAARLAAGAAAFPSQADPFAATQGGRPSTLVLAGGGLLGGAVGFVGGGLLGAVIACDQDDTNEDGFCAIGGFVVGATVGDSALIPLGVHVVNGRRGNYGLSLLASAAIGGVGLALAIPRGEPAWLIPVPIAQLVSSIAIERGTARPTTVAAAR